MNARGIILGAVAAIGTVLAAGPFPSGVTRGRAPFVVTGNTGSVLASSPSQNGYMSATQASDLEFVLNNGGQSDPLTATRWSSSNGIDNLTTTAALSSNMEFNGIGGLTVADARAVGGQSVVASDTGTRADVNTISGTTTQVGGLTWTKSAFCNNGLGVVSNQFTQVIAGGGDCSLVNTSVGDGYAELTENDGQGWNFTGLMFRWDPVADSGFNLIYFNDGKYYLNRYTTGTPLTVFNGFCHTAPNPGNVMRATYTGSTINISCNGVQIGSITDSNFVTNTYTGMAFLAGGNAERFTNFSTGQGVSQSLLLSPRNSTPTFEESFTTFKMDHDASIAGQLTSTAAIGTPPMVITSTTVVTNLNADLVDGQHAAAFQPAGSYQPAIGHIPTVTLSGGGAVVAGAVGNGGECVCQNTSSTLSLQCQTTGTTLTITGGVGAEVVAYLCF